MTLRTKEHKEAYDLEEKPWKEEKPLSEKEWMWRSKKWFPKEDVAQALKKLKDFAPYDVRDIKRLNEYINEIFGDLNQNSLNFNSKYSLINDFAS